VSWRCKECHGWDYKGADGAYSKGSHFTGIKGVMGASGLAPEKLHEIIMNKTHAYTEDMISHSAMEKLALFLSAGLIDMDCYIDRETKVVRGNVQRGAAFFQTICAVCHGFDGKAMNFKDEEHPEYVGTVANENPWETLHKIRFGQPGGWSPSKSSASMIWWTSWLTLRRCRRNKTLEAVTFTGEGGNS